MSTELLKARAALAGISTYLKQGKLLAAVISFHDGLQVFVQSSPSLLRKEKEEFERYVEKAVWVVGQDRELKKMYPLALKYDHGKERELLSHVREIMNELQDTAVSEARKIMEEMAKAKAEAFAAAMKLLEDGEIEKAFAAFSKLIADFPDDTDLKAQIAELFLRYNRLAEAAEFFLKALDDFPESVHLFNRLGMVYRKMKMFGQSQEYYTKALEYCGDDENLLYNVGRLYVDWQKWDKVEEYARRALSINHEFTEAMKMLKYAQKRLKGD